MNSKFYISFEAARLLKEKGYDIRCDYVYTPDGRIISLKMLSNWSDDYLSAPTKTEVIDWLESKGIMIEVFSARIGENRKWCYSIINTKTDITIETPYKFSTRLEAEDAAIIKVLELL